MDDHLTSQDAGMQEAFSSGAFVLETQRQLSRDFARHGFSFGADFDTDTYETGRLHEAVKVMLGEIAVKAQSKWLPLMYTLDIPEHKYVKFFRESRTDWLSDFAWAVIRREAQKVFFRQMLK